MECERTKRRSKLLAQDVNGDVRDFCEVKLELLEWSADELTSECAVNIEQGLLYNERFESTGVREHVAVGARIFVAGCVNSKLCQEAK